MVSNNLFDPEYTSGNLTTIPFVVKWLSFAMVRSISVIGFCIVMFVLLRDALHALYAVFPRFFDKVHAAHQANVSLISSGSEGGALKKIKFNEISTFILSKFPDVKDITDFEGDVLDPKTYFMKALPLACVQIFVGVFVFYAYPAQVAEKFSLFGRGMADLFLDNTDPTALVESLPEKFAMAKLSTQGSKNPIDKVVLIATKRGFSAMTGTFQDMTKEARVQVGTEIENWMLTTINGISQYCDEDSYKVAINARVENQKPLIDKVHDQHLEGTHSYAYYKPVTDFSVGVPGNIEGKYLRIDLVFTEKSKKEVKLNAVDTVLTLPTNSKAVKSDKEVTITFTGGGSAQLAALDNTRGQWNGTDVKLKVDAGTTKITVTPVTSGKKLDSKGGDLANISGLSYVVNGKAHPIRTIKFSSGGGVSMSCADASKGIADWTWGAEPTPKDVEKKTEEDKPEKTSGDKGNKVGI